LQVLSKVSINGLRALLYLSSRNSNSPYTNIREMADDLDISFHFLTKVLQPLTQAGILHSYRGPNGGVALLADPEELKILDVVLLYEGEDFFDTCLLGLPGCGEKKPCAVHDFWKHAKENLKFAFQHSSIADLGNKIRLGHVRLTE